MVSTLVVEITVNIAMFTKRGKMMCAHFHGAIIEDTNT